ncbi:hypothetical protein [Caballeronia sp. M23-90]
MPDFQGEDRNELHGSISRLRSAPINPKWAFSAIAENGDLVVSLWQHKIKRDRSLDAFAYRVAVTRSGKNHLGHKLFAEHLRQAFEVNIPLRAVVATADGASLVDDGKDGSTIRKKFHLWREVVGKVREFDGDNYLIVFQPA